MGRKLFHNKRVFLIMLLESLMLIQSIGNDLCPSYAPFFGAMGAASALIFTVFGAAYGTAKSGVGISTMGVVKPELVMRAIIPVIFAGVVAIYGLIIAVIITTNLLPGGPLLKSSGTARTQGGYSLFKGLVDLGGGLACGLAGLGAGMCIGIVGDAGVRASAQQPRLYVGMVLILIFSEALGLYGLIVGIIMSQKTDEDNCGYTAPPAS